MLEIQKALELQKIKKFQEAEIIYKEILRTDPQNFNALQLLGYMKYQTGNFVEAESFIEKALKIYKESEVVLHNYGLVLCALGKFEESIEYFNKTLKINNTLTKVLFDKALALSRLNKINEALECYDKILLINSKDIDALYNKGILLQKKKDYKNSHNIFSKIIDLDEKYPQAYGYYLISKLSISDWKDYDKHLKKIEDLIVNNNLICDPFVAKSFIKDEKINQICSQNFFKFNFEKELFARKFKKTKKINIGYFSTDFKKHSVAYQMLDLFLHHDSEKFNFFFFSLGDIDQSDEIFEKISKFKNFYDLRNNKDEEIVKLSIKLNINIAIDLNGYTSGRRTSLFSKKIAPIQINFFGFAGTMGSNCYDYIISDQICIPKESKKYYNEIVLYLKNSFIPSNGNINYSNKDNLKKDLELDDNKFIFSCFNQNYKFNPLTFDTWSEILTAVDNSIIWLLDTNETAKKNILIEFEKRKIKSDRIKFAKFLPREDHLSRLKSADLFLDTFPFNGHTMVYDALYMGVPVLTLKGNDFAGRVASSMLETINLKELIAQNLNEYIKKAITIAKKKSLINELKTKVQNSKKNSNLFNTKVYTQNLENIFIDIAKSY